MAAERQGAAEARSAVPLERQPDECRELWQLLPRSAVVGRDILTVLDLYEDYIVNTINPSKRRCWMFNEAIRKGRSAQG